MKSPPLTGLSPGALKILVYLNNHPEAQDTVEGIAEWWLLELRIRNMITEVENDLAELVAQGLVLERSGLDGRVRYCLEPQERKTVAQHLQQVPPVPPAVLATVPVESAGAKPAEGTEV